MSGIQGGGIVRFTKAQQHRLDSVTLGCVSGGAGVFAIAAIVLGSGILPIHFALLLLLGLIVGVAASAPAIVFGRTRRRFLLLSVAAIVLTMVGASTVFIHFQETGLEHAKRYGETWAAAASAARHRNGAWPQSIGAVLPHGKPAAPRLPWPYLAFCSDEDCKVAGYFVSYRVAEPSPRLIVARRDIALEWNWTSSKWRNLR